MAVSTTPVIGQGNIKAKRSRGGFEAIARRDNAKNATKLDVHFRTCSEARAAGYRRMREGQPGYARHLDRDNDGIACE